MFKYLEYLRYCIYMSETTSSTFLCHTRVLAYQEVTEYRTGEHHVTQHSQHS